MAPPDPSDPARPDPVQTLLDRLPVLAPPVGSAGAAVTIVLRQGAREIEALLIERAVRPTDPASGQVALPGGHVDEGDGSLSRTALRELQEEVGLGEADLSGPLRYVETQFAERFRLHVAIFADGLAPAARAPMPSSGAEVASVFWLPRSALETSRRVERETPFGTIEVPATVIDGKVLWGFTRRVLRDFFGLPPEDPLAGMAFVPRRPESV